MTWFELLMLAGGWLLRHYGPRALAALHDLHVTDSPAKTPVVNSSSMPPILQDFLDDLLSGKIAIHKPGAPSPAAA